MQNSTPARLRPLKAGEILDRAFQLYRANFMLFLGVASLALMPLLLLELLATYFNLPHFILQIFELFIRVNVVNGAMIWVAWRLYVGQPVSIFKAYWRTLGYSVALFVANFRFGLIYLFAFVFLCLGLIFVGLISTPFVTGGYVGLITFVVVTFLSSIAYILFWYVRWGLYLPIIMIEGLGAGNALKRSWFFIKQDFSRAFVVLVTSSLFSYLVGFLPVYVVNILAEWFHFDSGLSFLNVLLSLFGTIISLPLTTSALVILYYDLIVRYEGYDFKLALGMMDEELGMLLDDEPVY